MADNSTPPTPDHFDDELHQILALINVYGSNGSGGISSLDIYKRLLDEYDLYIHWRTIDKILSEQRDLVRRRKQNNRWHYTLLADGKSLVSHPESAAILIDPSKALQEVIALHDRLGSLNGEIRVCDPYLVPATIEHLHACPTASPIKLLTCNIRNKAELRRLLAAAKMAGYDIEIRENTQKNIHDRYIIDDDSILHLGTSLNGFANKQHFIIELGEDMHRLTLQDFNSRWSSANPWP